MQALKRGAIEDALTGGQAAQIDARGKVTRLERCRPDDPARVLE